MPGPAVRHRPFHNYLKTSGDSTPDASRGGSHGLGKFAPLANTPLRTIFVSTKWDEGDEEKALFQGLTFLAGRENPDGTSIGQKGFWGGPNFMPIEQVPEEYSWMQREAVGTSIYLIGWDSPERWDALVLGHALINFFAAFQRRKLVVSVKKPGAKEITIGDDNDFAKYFGIEVIRTALSKDTDDALERLNRSQYYLKCINGSDEIISQDTQVNPGIEASKVSLFKDEEAPQKIAFIRNNILITDQIPYFYKQKSQQFENYVGVFEVVNDEGYKLLRRMENPSHTALSEDWLPLEERRKGKRALAALGQKLKDIVKDKLSIQADIDPGPIEILKEFFSDEAGEGADNLENEDINPTGKFKVTSQPPKFAPPPVINIADKEADEDVEISEDEPGTAGGSGTGGGGGGDGGGHGTGHGSGSGGTEISKQNRAKNIDSIKLKTKRVVSISGSKVTAVVVADKATTVKLTLQEIGADYFEELPVVSCFMASRTREQFL